MSWFINLISFSWVFDTLKKMCVFIDWCIYSVASWFFNAFYAIAKMDVDGQFTELNAVIDRIELFVGIFILFILVKTIISYIADPEKVVAGSKKVLINIIVSVIMLVMAPTVFGLLNDFQRSIIEQNTISKLLMGPQVGLAFDESDNAGKIFVNNIYSLFFYCEEEQCDITAETAVLNVRTGVDEISNLSNFTDSTGVVYEYPVVSGIVGLVLCYYFLVFALALGIRMFKLLILQVLSPIPIIAYIDPNKKSFFDKYVKLYLNVYLELFVRLFVIFFVYNMGATLIQALNYPPGEDKGFLVTLILIVALFQFAKQVPKLLSDLLGIDTSFGELKSTVGGMLGVAGGAAIGLGTGLITGAKTRLTFGDTIGHTVGSSISGAVSGYSGGKKGLGGFISGAAGSAAGGYAAANQIYTAGGYGNYLKGKLLERSGYGTYAEKRRERLDDAAKRATDYKDKVAGYGSRVDELKTKAREAYDKRNNGGVENSFAYQSALDGRKNATTQAEYDRYNNELNRLETQYNIGFEKFYDDAMAGNIQGDDIVTLAGMKDKIESEIGDVFGKDESLSLETYAGLDKAKSDLEDKMLTADFGVDRAEGELKEFVTSKPYEQVSYHKTHDNKYHKREERGFAQTPPTSSNAGGRSQSTSGASTSSSSSSSGSSRPSSSSGASYTGSVIQSQPTTSSQPRSRTVYNPALERELANLEERAKANPNDAGLQREIEAIKKELGR